MARPELSEEERAKRKNELLVSARDLYSLTGQVPTVQQIATRAGVAKGTVYSYFATKEELCIGLLEYFFSNLLQSVEAILGSLRFGKNLEKAAIDFAAAYCEALSKMPELLPLASMGHAVFEQNLPEDTLVEFKRRLGYALVSTGSIVESAFPDMAPGDGARLLLRTWSLTVGLWQTVVPPAQMKALLGQPGLELFNTDFFEELQDSIVLFWRGTMTTIV